MIKKRALPIIILLVLACSPLAADSVYSPERQITKLADGIYTIRHKDPFPGWVNGNTTVIIGTREVFVVDSCQMPSAAREDIAQIRKWSDKPVRYLLTTHWHTDHNGGNNEYAKAFPSVAIIARPETRVMMDGASSQIATSWTKDATASQAALTQRLASGKTTDGKPLTDAQTANLRERLDLLTRILEEAKTFVYQAPTMTFDRELRIDIGGREIEVKYLGRANTGGDALVYLPQEQILITGDTVVHPVPYAFDGYPAEWIQTLQAMAQLQVKTIVPGHGEVLHDKTFIYQLIDLMKSILGQVSEQLRKNPEVTLEQVKKSLDLKTFRKLIGGDDPANGAFFDTSIGSSFVELAYHELKQR